MSDDGRQIKVRASNLIAWGALLVLGQLLITHWTIEVAGNREVIDYVSFAGTVVGMILAVLAIVYSYLANASQKDDAVALRSQIGSLNDAITRAQASGTQFSTQVEKLEEIRERIAIVVENSEASLEASGRLEGLLGQISKEKPDDPGADAAADALDALDAASILRFFASRAAPQQIILYYLGINDDEQDDNFKKELYDSIILPRNSSWKVHWYDGQLLGYYWIFYDLGAIKDTHLRLEFLQALRERVNAALEYIDRGSGAARYAPAMMLVRDRINKELGD